MTTYHQPHYNDIIKKCYSEDQALLDVYHITSGKGLDGCVSRTIDDLQKADKSFKFFVIMSEDNKLVGYFGKESIKGINWLSTIFVRPTFRNKDHISKFWDSIKKEMGNKFFTAIYNKNTRAVKFFSKNGSIKMNLIVDEQPATLFEFKESSCQ